MFSSRNEVAEPPPPPATRLQTVPEPASPPGMPPSRFSRTRLIIFVCGFLAVCVVVVITLARKTGRTARSSPGSSRVSNRDGSVLRLKGTTQAIRSRAILAPMLSGQQVGTLTITKLLSAGTRVHQGDVLVEFDRQAQVRDAVDKQAEYAKLVDQVAQEQAKEKAARAKDETELQQAESELSKAQLEMQKTEILSRIDVEKARESLEQAKATLDQLRETFDLKRKAATAAIRILEIQRDRTRETMLHAEKNAELMQVHSPLDGVVVLNTIWKEGKMGEVQEGDHVRPGVPFMQVVDPSSMQVAVQVNQEDFPSLKIGEPAKIRLDAYPDMIFDGNLQQLAPVGRSGDFSQKVRTFTAIFSIGGTDPKLMPDLSAAVDIGQHDDARASSRAQ